MKARPVSPWATTLNGFTNHLEASSRSAATVDTYRLHADWLSTDFPEDPWAVTSAELEKWLDAHQWSAHTRRKVLVSLRAFYAWGIHDGQCSSSPLAGLSALPPRLRGPHRSELSPQWVEPVQEFLSWLRAGARLESTLEQRRWWLTRLSETYANPWTVTTSELARWLSRDDWAPQTKRQGKSSIQTFYRWAEMTGRVETSPARDLPSVLVRRALPRPTPDDVVRAGLGVADERVRLAILMAAYAGLRRAEIAQLHVRDIGDDSLLIVGKGGHERLVPLHPDLRTELRAEMTSRRQGVVRAGWGRVCPSPDGWLFPSDDPTKPVTAAHLGKLIAAALPGHWTAHTLRHRFATQAFAAERDLRAVQELLGHAKPETTAIYAAVPDGALAAAVAGVRALD